MKRITTLLLTAAALLLVTVTAFADTIPGTAKCTITPTDTKVDGNTATVTYSVTVTPPEGKELGVFSVRLQPSEGMTLAKDWKDASGNRTIGFVDDLTYNQSRPNGIFATFDYTPETGYFAAVGTTPERRMSEKATILTIQATMPADKAGTYTLGAEFIAALDGSGDVYTARVETNPVTISGKKDAPVIDETPVVTETDADTPAASDGDPAGAGDSTVSTGTNGGTAADGTPEPDAADMDPAIVPDGAAPGTDGSGSDASGGGASAAGSTVLWIVLALVVALAVVLFLLWQKKSKKK